ncbi:MAG: PLP-dependent aminotransferase family protein [Holophaga sp.]|nr:PLP-dependent aminotransferase family protein [Holophaga sp.]
MIEKPGVPLGQRIVLTIQNAVLEGRLPLGSLLPGSRTLADLFGVNRRTITRALEELLAQGWIETRPNCGTYLVNELPSGIKGAPPATPPPEPRVGFDVPSVLQSISTYEDGVLLLGDGAPDPRLAPVELLAKAYQRALRRDGSRLLDDRDPLGTPLLRESVAAWMLDRHGLRIGPDQVLITRGSRGALALLGSALFRPGSLVAVEDPGNRGAWDILRQNANLELRPVPVDAQGLVPEALEALLAKERVHLLLLTPRHHFPTTATLPAERKAAILELAARYRVAIIEDDYDGEYHYEALRPEILLTMDKTGQVIHIGSLSRMLAPGLKLGFIVLPSPLVPFMARVKRSRQEQSDPVLEWAVADLIRDGDLGRHLRKTRKIYQTRRDHLVGRLRECLGAHLDVQAPSGGTGLWLRVKPPVDAQALVRAARKAGLVLYPPSHFFMGKAESCFRMGFAQADEAELDEAVRRLGTAVNRCLPPD